ncbi:TPA: imidazoleglycerol-phosphate dehydratase HisB [Candidatus Woesearchaeota archaeon]|nr:imidazoleglycerol-phosphate dehydratase HisB [Candidatus Woesearchaeota archaeon]HII64365.1 imidazoleglycerol-phosphate dehydratase HisB [Candidatus Woesearchaeota archaeon]HIJ18619.1 imidazoleglycerol-phosphate dehydratase HisB [Candidatus Woesearchaeota archaeon]
MRCATIRRKTKETDIALALNIDGKGKSTITTSIGFLTHMLESFAKHGLFDIRLRVKGDVDIDQHHTIEDTGIALGQAFGKALGSKKGINRAGYFIFPMDEALAIVAVDIGGRPYLKFNGTFKRRFCGGLDTDVLEDFFYGFSIGLGANIAIQIRYGRSDHHKIEAVFKAFAKAMKAACSTDKRAVKELPSTKGLI